MSDRVSLVGRDLARLRAAYGLAGAVAAASETLVGQTFRSNLGGYQVTVVAEDERFIYVLRADSSKRSLANTSGGYIIARSEFAAEWLRVTPPPPGLPPDPLSVAPDTETPA